jgi:inhibitor of KinA
MQTPVAGGAQFLPASDQSLLVTFGREITPQGHESVRKLLRLLESQPVAGVLDRRPAYCSLLVTFDALRLRHDDLETILQGYLRRLGDVSLPEPRLVQIPVCYSGEFAPDLDDVAAMHGIPPAQVVELHVSISYLVYFLGFVPGFAYLGELPDALSTPRLAMPRRRVPAGSVGIGGKQTGVYPCSSPGGWRLIGRTPMAMFRPERSEMNLLSIGDRVRFVAISEAQFAAWDTR